MESGGNFRPNQVMETVEEVTECPICREQIREPKILPCVHSFCLKCLEKHGQDRIAGESLPCPCCRKLFKIPRGGFSQLQNNYYLQKLILANVTYAPSDNIQGQQESRTQCDINMIEQMLSDCMKVEESLESKKEKFLRRLLSVEKDAKTHCDQFHALINEHRESMVSKLNDLKGKCLKDMAINKEKVDNQIQVLESLKKECEEVKMEANSATSHNALDNLHALLLLAEIREKQNTESLNNDFNPIFIASSLRNSELKEILGRIEVTGKSGK